MPSATASLAQAPGINHTTLKAKGFTDEVIAKVEKALPTAFDIKFVFNKWTLGEEFCRDTLGLSRRATGLADLRPPGRHRLYQARDRGLQHPCLRRHDRGRRAAPESRTLRGVRLRQPVRQDRQALSVGRKPHQDDGGGAALHLGRDLQDHQHAERGHRRRLQAGLHAVLASGAQSQRALSRRLQAVAAVELAADRRR